MAGRSPTYEPHSTHRSEALRGAPFASFRARAVGLALDFLIAGLSFTPLAVLLLKGLDAAGLLHHDRKVNVEFTFFHNWYSIVWLVGYFGLSNYLGNGRTLGKRMAGIRAVSLVHERLSLWHSFERALGYGASALEFGFGFVQYFIHPQRQCVHDRIAETIVIRTRVPKAQQAAGGGAAPGSAAAQ